MFFTTLFAAHKWPLIAVGFPILLNQIAIHFEIKAAIAGILSRFVLHLVLMLREGAIRLRPEVTVARRLPHIAVRLYFILSQAVFCLGLDSTRWMAVGPISVLQEKVHHLHLQNSALP